MTLQPPADLLSFILLLSVAGAALGMFLVNLGSSRVLSASELDEAPQVARWPQVMLIAAGSGLLTAAALALLASPPLALLGLFAGGFVALSVRAARLRAWSRAMARETQAVIVNLLISMDSGEGSAYRGLQNVIAEGELRTLGPILERHVLARVAAGAFLEDTLVTLTGSRMMSYAPIARDALTRLADLVGRDVSAACFVDGLRIMDTTMTDIVRIDQEQAAQLAQIRYSAYIVTGLVIAMAALLILAQSALADGLLRTLPGNLVLSMVALMVMIALMRAEYGAKSEPLRF